MLNKYFVTTGLLFSALAFGPPAIAADGQYLDAKGDRIEERLDDKGDRIDNRLDRRSAIADAHGKDRVADRLDRKGNRINERLDRRSAQVGRRARSRG